MKYIVKLFESAKNYYFFYLLYISVDIIGKGVMVVYV